ncbi:hypothetical protein NX794_34260 [Streptomyces sp. LP11]|uniref:Secreted protein n=1 Tax=Streptomyces pyxinicus TaxID=2970331 RepID=A0ABT2BCI6_9ACTN|nr:hypothetical protein [Streptomyces sp. LP11]MCS0606238.1 hypothetical protein [Streptomyces sp. LP11]
MGSLRLTLCTGILAAAVCTPAAHAASGGPVTVTPASPAPGGAVTVRAGGCTGARATAASTAFVADAVLTGGQGTVSGETQVRTSVQPGAYDVKVTCAGTVTTGTLTVGSGGGGGLGQLEQLIRPFGTGASAVAPSETPVAPVDAGGGGTAHFATVATSGSGPGNLQAVTGLALAGIAAVVVGRRARRSRGTR